MPQPEPNQPANAPAVAHSVAVYPAALLRVISGANAGDDLPDPSESVTGDFYRLADGAEPLTLRLDLGTAGGTTGGATGGTLAPGGDLGHAGAAVTALGNLSLMAPGGDPVEVIVLAVEGVGRVALPLSPLLDRRDYTLIAASAHSGPIRLADVVAGAFARGTRIALADGRQEPVEDLQPGDLVITRDHGVQPLRWKGAVRLRAEGGFAPVTVLPGVMGNLGALTVSPNHRLFLYRRDAKPVAGAAELLVQARHLVDGQSILRREGGYVEYYSLVFDAHEVIYAQGVPCESLMVCPATLTRLPEAMAAPLRAAFPGLSQRLHTGADLRPDLVSTLRPARAAPNGTP